MRGYNGEILKDIRLQLKMTQAEFGKEINIVQARVSDYERAYRKPPINICKRIKKLLEKHKIFVTLETLRPDLFTKE